MSEAHLNKLMQRRGAIATITTVRKLKTRKGAPEVTKTSTFQCRVGVDYENLPSTIQGRADGTLPAVNHGLPWGEWAEFPYLIKHNDQHYFRCTRIDNNYISKTVYTIEGSEVHAAVAQQFALASEFRDGDASTVFTIKVASIVDVA